MDVDDFFQHENQSAPPSLSDCGKLRFSAKSDLLPCLEKLCAKQRHILKDGFAVILDGAVVVQMLKPSCVKTFGEYATEVFMPYIAAVTNSLSCRFGLGSGGSMVGLSMVNSVAVMLLQFTSFLSI